MTQFTPRHIPVKPTRRSPKAAEPFGSGILATVPHYGGQPFTASDAAWAAQSFGDDDGVDWDALARDAEIEDAWLEATGGYCYCCERCGLEDETREGLCGGCEAELAWAGVV